MHGRSERGGVGDGDGDGGGVSVSVVVGVGTTVTDADLSVRAAAALGVAVGAGRAATVVTIDRAGRVSVPKELREYAGLERESVWAGVVERIELWSKKRWDELRRAQAPDDVEKTREYLERHGL